MAAVANLAAIVPGHAATPEVVGGPPVPEVATGVVEGSNIAPLEAKDTPEAPDGVALGTPAAHGSQVSVVTDPLATGQSNSMSLVPDQAPRAGPVADQGPQVSVAPDQATNALPKAGAIDPDAQMSVAANDNANIPDCADECRRERQCESGRFTAVSGRRMGAVREWGWVFKPGQAAESPFLSSSETSGDRTVNMAEPGGADLRRHHLSSVTGRNPAIRRVSPPLPPRRREKATLLP